MLNLKQYNTLRSIVSEISRTANLAASLKEYAEESEILARLLSDHFANSEEKCANFIKENSCVEASIDAMLIVSYAKVSANFYTEEEISEENAKSFIEENFSFAHVNAHDYADVEVEDVDLLFTYTMKSFEQSSYAA